MHQNTQQTLCSNSCQFLDLLTIPDKGKALVGFSNMLLKCFFRQVQIEFQTLMGKIVPKACKKPSQNLHIEDLQPVLLKKKKAEQNSSCIKS